ncbi:MAG: diadenylate cyclase CdaA [Clostridia bacterium]|nr:diadenylate cyclase CdaA [Clostridia bacterium]
MIESQEMINVIQTFFDDYILFPINNMHPVTDILDILLLTGLLYYLYRFVRRRRAGKLLLGIAALFGIFMICSVLDMKALGLIMDNFLTVGLVAVVIIFQPELRDALERVGSTSLRIGRLGGDRGGSDAEIEHISAEIASAACSLSSEGYGALIVVQRTTKLQDYMDKGERLDAKVSEKLLRNIFVNKSPLHDGAVIIEGDRIAAAACKLPLSENEEVVRDLGTRHRAGVGITEVSDAMVVIVSEENGIISIAYGGSLYRNYDYKNLHDAMYSFMDYRRKKPTHSGDAKVSESADVQSHLQDHPKEDE